VPFPSGLVGLLNVFSFLAIDPIKNFKGMCIGEFNLYNNFLWNILMPLILSLTILIVYFIKKPPGADADATRKFSAFYWNLFCMLLFIIYPGTSKSVVSMFNCQSIQVSNSEARSFLYADYRIECFEGSWGGYAGIAAVMILLYPIGVPAFFFLALRSHSKRTIDGVPLEEARKEDPDAQSALVKDPVINEQFGFLYARFKPDFWWYETSELARKFFVGSLTMFIKPGTATQTMVAVGINTYFLCQLLVCWPFKAYDDNMLMAISMVATSVTLFGALIIQGRIDYIDQWADGVTTGLLLGSTVILFILYCAMLVRFQLPFICNWFMPDFIRESPLNCFRKPPAPPPAAAKTEAPVAGGIAYDVVVLQPPPPIPTDVEVDMEAEELDKLIDEYFHRYDLDESGTMNQNEELKQLCTNLSFKLKLTLTGDEIDAIVASAGELSKENEWQLDEFSDWFQGAFLGVMDEDFESLQGDIAMAISLAQNVEMDQNLMADMGGDDGGDGD